MGLIQSAKEQRVHLKIIIILLLFGFLSVLGRKLLVKSNCSDLGEQTCTVHPKCIPFGEDIKTTYGTPPNYNDFREDNKFMFEKCIDKTVKFNDCRVVVKGRKGPECGKSYLFQ